MKLQQLQEARYGTDHPISAEIVDALKTQEVKAILIDSYETAIEVIQGVERLVGPPTRQTDRKTGENRWNSARWDFPKTPRKDYETSQGKIIKKGYPITPRIRIVYGHPGGDHPVPPDGHPSKIATSFTQT